MSIEQILRNIISQEIWEEFLEKTKQFVLTHHKKPSQRSADENEKNLGIWVRIQVDKYTRKKNYMSEGRYIRKKWEEFITNESFNTYFLPAEEIWDSKIDKAKKLMVENRHEDDLGKWLYHQFRKYTEKRGSMVDGATRRKKWENFMEHVKDYYK